MGRESRMYGWRGKIGLLIPAVNATMEREFHSLAGEGLSIHTTRVEFAREGTLETLYSQEENALAAGALIRGVEPDVVLYGCTSGSFVGGPSWNHTIEEKLQSMCGCPAVTTTGAMLRAAETMRMHRPLVVTPYVQATNDRLVAYLAESGTEPAAVVGFDMLDTFEHANIRPELIYRTVRMHLNGDVDGVFIACTQLRALEIVEALEQDFQLPVVTANQASYWASIRALGLDGPRRGPGKLFES